jgi:hypothetical protein
VRPLVGTSAGADAELSGGSAARYSPQGPSIAVLTAERRGGWLAVVLV